MTLSLNYSNCYFFFFPNECLNVIFLHLYTHTVLLWLCAHSVVLRYPLGGDWPPCCPTVRCSTDSDTGPMEEWNRDALFSLQGELEKNVIMKNWLINKLQKATGGFMNEEEAQSVESKPSNAEQMRELIQILRGKGNADFSTFCRMLHQSNYSVWANQLERKAREFRGKPGAHHWVM